DSCVITGSIHLFPNSDDFIGLHHSTLTGPGYCGVLATTGQGCSITGNTISGFTIGILEDSDGPAYSIRDNVVTSCSSIGIAIGGRDSPGDISRNLVERCGIGISVGSPGLVQDNVVLDCSGEGMRLGFYG